MGATDLELTAVERVILEQVTRDEAARWHRTAPGSAARYVVEGTLEKLLPRHDWRKLIDEVDAYIQANRHVLTFDHEHVSGIQEQREIIAVDYERSASEAFNAGDHAEALRFLRCGLAEVPMHRFGFQSWQDIIDFVEEKAKG